MSSYLAVGGVSAVLRWLLTDALTSGGPSGILGGTTNGITVTSPDLVPVGADEQPGVNIFMYYASLNPALRNMGLPARNALGQEISNPPLALNLHYLVSAYGSKPLDPEILLGWAMKVLHDTPVVPRDMIQKALDALLPGGSPEGALIEKYSLLASQFEHIRITPETLTTEEIYRLWSAFQTSYRPTTSYQVSVAVVQDSHAYTSHLPVQKRSVMVLPLQPPVIDSIVPGAVAPGGMLTVQGSNFVGDASSQTLVSIDGAQGFAPATLQSKVLRVALPTTLQAGTRLLRVQRTVTFPTSSAPHAGFSSSPMPFQLLPTITGATPDPVAQSGSVTVTVTPPVGSMQQATLYVGDVAIPIDQRPTSTPPTSSTLVFPLANKIPVGTYPLRIDIDGAQSRLTLDTSGGTPQYTPQLQVTP